MPILFELYLKRHLDGKNYFSVENIQVIEEGELVNSFLQLEAYVVCITVTDLRSLALKVTKLNNFSRTPNNDRYCAMGLRDDTHI